MNEGSDGVSGEPEQGCLDREEFRNGLRRLRQSLQQDDSASPDLAQELLQKCPLAARQLMSAVSELTQQYAFEDAMIILDRIDPDSPDGA